MSSLDSLITSDLAALGDDSRRHLVGLDDALRTTNMYRDDRPGAEARRDALVDERRRELVMMPLTLSHVFAHRVGRAAAGAAGLACTVVLLAMLADPLLLRLAAWFVPGLNVGMLCALSAIVILKVYVLATWIAEAWFARRMRGAIQTGDDPYRDLDALARGPVEIAQHAVRRVDGISMGLFLAGFTAITLSFGYVGVIVGALHEFPHAWSITGILRSDALGKNLDVLVLALLGTAIVAFFVGRACQRVQGSALVRFLGHWSVLVIAGLAALATAYVGIHTLHMISMRRDLPSYELRELLGIGSTIAILGAVTWSLLWWRRREQARIGE
jgi:hypothetical protein